MKENYGNINGFRVGEYFITFPPGDFIKEDREGKLFAELDIYKIDKNNKASKASQKEITPELEQLINDELNKFLLAAIQNDKANINK